MPTPLTIVFQDADFIAVDKPPGMIVHRSSGNSDEGIPLLQSLRDQIGRRVFPVHRIDQPTSGIVLFGLRPESAAALVDLFTTQRITKYYQALVRGWSHLDGRLSIPLVELTLGMKSRIASPESAKCRTLSAATTYSTIRWFEGPWSIDGNTTSRFSLVEVSPKTGRTHQIRRHLKHIAHPIIGDYRHGDSRYNAWLEQTFKTDVMLLSSLWVSFQHPFRNIPVTIRAQRSQAMDAVLAELDQYAITMRASRLPPQPISQRLEV